MQQYFIKGQHQLHDCITFDEEQSHHIQHVLRMREHEQVRVVDEAGHVFLAQLNANKSIAQAVLMEALPSIQTHVSITLALALIKKERFDYAIQKACELGVSNIVPLLSTRCVVKVKEDALEKKQTRWNKIALEACEQCKRSDLVEVKLPATIQEVLQQEAQVKLLAYENADHQADQLKHIVEAHPDVRSILVLIGPEGGFTMEEVKACLDAGCHCISLGPRILRAETAALAAINTLNVLYEQ